MERPSNPEKRREIQQRVAEAKANGEPIPKRSASRAAKTKENQMTESGKNALQAKIDELESELSEVKGTRGARSDSRDPLKGRKARGPLGGSVQKLACTDIPGYHVRWVNDEAGRVQMFLNNDYDYVTLDDIQTHGLQVGHGAIDGNTDTGAYVSMVVGRNDNGSEKRAFLMKIPKEWYTHDQKEKMKAIDESEAQYKEGNLNIPDEMRYKVQDNQI